MKKKGRTEYPEVGDKVWRELSEEDKAMKKGANGRVVKIDWGTSPPEYIVIFPAPTDDGVVSRVSLERDDMGYWTSAYNGTWVIGDITTY